MDRSFCCGLVEHADVVVENFRPGTLERWNLGYDQLSEVNPRIVLARVSGYGQTGPYAERAGFASVSEAMGGIRHINGFPDQPPPRMHLSLGDSLAGLFAVHGILSALYWRDALGGGVGQVVDVSLMEASFALLESTVPEYDRLGIVRGPQGTNLKGIAPSNIFKSSDDKWVVIAANADNVFRRLCDAIGRPELADDPKFATHLARGDNQDEIEGIVADWARERTAKEIDETLNDAGVICGPIYTIADIFDDPQYQARDMLLAPRRPRVRRVHRPGDRAEAVAHARSGALVGHVGRGQPQPGGLRRPVGARGRGARRAARGGRALTAVTICDVAPRDGLQNDAAVLDPVTRAELVNRLARAGVPRIEAVSFVNPAGCRRWRGPRTSSPGSTGWTGSPTQAWRSTSAATSGCARRRSTKCTSPSRSATSSTGATRAPAPRTRSRRASGSWPARTRTACGPP